MSDQNIKPHLKYVHGNILCGHGNDRRALYRLEPLPSYPYHPDKVLWWRRLALLVYRAQADVSILRVNRLYDPERYADQALGLLDDRYGTNEAFAKHLAGHQEYLTTGLRWFPEVYLSIQLRPREDGFWSTIVRDSDQLRSWIEALARTGTGRAVPGTEIKALEEAEKKLYSTVAGVLPARRATTREFQWLHRRLPCAGLTEPLLDDHWEPDALVLDEKGEDLYEPLGSDLEQLLTTRVRNESGALRVRADEGENWHALLALGDMPRDLQFPGETELLFSPLEDLRFPVDAVMHMEYVSNSAAITKVNKSIRTKSHLLLDQAITQHGMTSWGPQQDAKDALKLQQSLERQPKPPMLLVSRLLHVGGAKDPQELKSRVTSLRDRFGTVALHQPADQQRNLYYDFLPRADGGKVRSWQKWMTLEAYAAHMPIATHGLRATRGIYFARVVGGSRRPIFDDIGAASREHRAPSRLFVGTSGSGKTTAALQACVQRALAGGQVITLDPGPDHNLEGVEELEGRVGIIDLDSPDDYPGLLDPLVILPKGRKIDGAYSYLMSLIGDSELVSSTKVRAAVTAVVQNSSQPGCNQVIDYLLKSPDEISKTTGDALATWASAGLPRFGFSDGVVNQGFARHQVETIRPSALNLPPASVSRDNYEDDERISVATYRLIANYAMTRLTNDRSVRSTLFIDEGHFVMPNSAGQRTADNGVRQGRKWNAELFFASQFVADPGELAKLMGMIYVFGFEHADEAKAAVRLLGLDHEDEKLVEDVRSSRKGLCYIRDMHGDLVKAQIDLVFPSLLRALDTSPEARSIREQAAV
jgi:RecA/RadA recombinase